MAVNYNIPFQTQLDYMMQELRGPESATMDAFKSAGAITPQDYAELFEQKYERAGGSALDRRKQYALEVFKGMGQEVPDLPQNVIRAYKYFTDQGFTPAQASGIVGNLMTESYAHLDPNAYNPAGGGMGAYGIAQFRGSRLKGLLDFAGQQGDTNMDQTVGAPLQASMGGNQQSERGAMSKLRGLLDFASERNPETGLSRFEQFAAALDPLIMPDMRAGEAIQQRGEQRVQSARTNKTIEWLKKNGYPDIANIVEQNPQLAASTMTEILKRRMQPKTSGYNKEQISLMGSLRDDLRKDTETYKLISEGYDRIKAFYNNPNAVTDYALAVAFAKVLDPGSVAREGEVAAVANAGAKVPALGQALKNAITGEGQLTPTVRQQIAEAARGEYMNVVPKAQSTIAGYERVAGQAGLTLQDIYAGPQFEMPDPIIPSIIPQSAIDAGLDQEDWTNMPIEDKRKFVNG